MTAPGEDFELRSVVHLVRPAGLAAQNLVELHHAIAEAPEGALFYHAVQYQLRHPVGVELPPDDFSAWVRGVLQDPETAERLSFSVQTLAGAPGALRRGLLDVLEDAARRHGGHGAPPEGRFVLLEAESVVCPTGERAADGAGLLAALTAADASVWFYHLLEEPWKGGGAGTALGWLRARGEERLAATLERGASAGLPLEGARQRMRQRWHRSRLGPRLAEAAGQPEDVRREAGREAISRLLRRRRGDGDAA